jgi:hypothetical protein
MKIVRQAEQWSGERDSERGGKAFARTFARTFDARFDRPCTVGRNFDTGSASGFRCGD